MTNSRNLRASAGGSFYLTLASLLITLVNMGNKASSVIRVFTLPHDQSVTRQESKNVSSMWPFSANLPKELNFGDKIEIEGKLADDAEIFSINLVCHHDPSEKPHNIAYHHKVHFSEVKTILNAKINGNWQDEEVIDEAELAPGEQFQIMLMIHEDGIYTYYNGSNRGLFTHRIPIKDVKYLQIWDGIERVESMKVIFAEAF